MFAHQHFGHGADVILVEQPYLKRRHLLGIAHPNRLADAHTALAEEVALLIVNAEGLVEQIVAQHVGRLEGRNRLRACLRRNLGRCLDAGRHTALRHVGPGSGRAFALGHAAHETHVKECATADDQHQQQPGRAEGQESLHQRHRAGGAAPARLPTRCRSARTRHRRQLTHAQVVNPGRFL